MSAVNVVYRQSKCYPASIIQHTFSSCPDSAWPVSPHRSGRGIDEGPAVFMELHWTSFLWGWASVVWCCLGLITSRFWYHFYVITTRWKQQFSPAHLKICPTHVSKLSCKARQTPEEKDCSRLRLLQVPRNWHVETANRSVINLKIKQSFVVQSSTDLLRFSAQFSAILSPFKETHHEDNNRIRRPKFSSQKLWLESSPLVANICRA